MQHFFSPHPLWLKQGTAIVRIILGALMIYHGLEVFDAKLMQEYMKWDQFKGPMSEFLVYAGKSSELIAGIAIFLGLFTRLGALLAIGTFSYITFFVGQGKFWYGDQHPFMFVLFGLLFIFTGPGAWSLDGLLFKSKDNNKTVV